MLGKAKNTVATLKILQLLKSNHHLRPDVSTAKSNQINDESQTQYFIFQVLMGYILVRKKWQKSQSINVIKWNENPVYTGSEQHDRVCK